MKKETNIKEVSQVVQGLMRILFSLPYYVTFLQILKKLIEKRTKDKNSTASLHSIFSTTKKIDVKHFASNLKRKSILS